MLMYDVNHPEFEIIDDFNFINYADIGSIVYFEAMGLIHVKVEAIKYPKVIKYREKESI